ncbi:unnamed protein product [Clonostachys rosea f. rosea IK726]|uniref:Uncharacterized protein n=1 Tax=Clonostachys rosea f. rosea IK726 TaxID=1349383 RepID=A0ACA9TKY6_BIOOC|nr:unnamed protein product [Clonostachys rosea f. rosea IK726]
MAPQDLTGIMVALYTPFKDDTRAIDVEALTAHVESLIQAGVHGLVPGGSTGEFTALSYDERKQLIEVVLAAAKGRVPVVAGIGDLSTAKVLDLAKHAAEAGAAATMIVPPFYDSPNLEELREFFKEVYEVSKIPIMYYNIPSASGVKLSPTELAGLSDVGVKFLKDTSGDAPSLTQLLFEDAVSSKIVAFNGWDTLTFYGLAAGAKGSVWGTTNILPELSVELWNAVAVNGDLKKGREIWAKIYPLCKVLESYNYCAGVKTAMELKGVKTGGIRKPFKLLTGDAKAELAAALKIAGVKVVE